MLDRSNHNVFTPEKQAPGGGFHELGVLFPPNFNCVAARAVRIRFEGAINSRNYDFWYGEFGFDSSIEGRDEGVRATIYAEFAFLGKRLRHVS
jgi:hypothetical protein